MDEFTMLENFCEELFEETGHVRASSSSVTLVRDVFFVLLAKARTLLKSIVILHLLGQYPAVTAKKTLKNILMLLKQTHLAILFLTTAMQIAASDLSVTVVDRENSPVNGVLVAAYSNARMDNLPKIEYRTTGRAGECSFTRLSPGDYMLRIMDTINGLVTDTSASQSGGKIWVKKGQNSIRLVARNGAVLCIRLIVGPGISVDHGILSDQGSKSGLPFAGHLILAELSGKAEMNFQLYAPPYAPRTIAIKWQGKAVTDTVFDLSKEKIISGIFVDNEGKPVTGVRYATAPRDAKASMVPTHAASMARRAQGPLSGNDGKFFVETSERGPSRIIVHHPECLDTMVQLGNAGHGIRITLTKAPKPITGKIEDYPGNGNCIVHISEMIMRRGAPLMRMPWETSVPPDKNGAFRVNAPYNSSYSVCAVCEGYDISCDTVSQGEATGALALAPQGTIQGRVVFGESGAPATKFDISSEKIKRMRVEDDHGRFSIPSSRRGLNRICVSAPNYSEVCDTVSCNGTTVEMPPIELSRSYSLSLRIKTKIGKVKGGAVSLQPENRHMRRAGQNRLFGFIDSSGAAAIGSIPEGRYSLLVDAKDCIQYSERIEIRGDLEKDIEVDIGSSISGTLRIEGKDSLEIQVLAVPEIEQAGISPMSIRSGRVEKGEFIVSGTDTGYYSLAFVCSRIRVLQVKRGIAAGSKGVAVSLCVRPMLLHVARGKELLTMDVTASIFPADSSDTRQVLQRFKFPVPTAPYDTIYGVVGQQYEIAVSGPGFSNCRKVVTVPEGQNPYTIECVVDNSTSSQESSASNDTGGETGFSATIYDYNRKPVGSKWAVAVPVGPSSLTNAHGKFLIPLPVHAINLLAVHDPSGNLRYRGYVNTRKPFDRITLAKPGIVYVFVQNVKGSPVFASAVLAAGEAPIPEVGTLAISKPGALKPVVLPPGSYYARVSTPRSTQLHPFSVESGQTDSVRVVIPQWSGRVQVKVRVPDKYKGKVDCFLFQSRSRWDPSQSESVPGDGESHVRSFVFDGVAEGDYRVIARGGEMVSPFYSETSTTFSKSNTRLNVTVPASGIEFTIITLQKQSFVDGVLGVWSASGDQSGCYFDYFPRSQTVIHPNQRVFVCLQPGSYYAFANSSRLCSEIRLVDVLSDTTAEQVNLAMTPGTPVSARLTGFGINRSGSHVCMLDSAGRPILKKWQNHFLPADSVPLGAIPPGRYTLYAQNSLQTSKPIDCSVKGDASLVIHAPLEIASWVRLKGGIRDIEAVSARNMSGSIMPSIADRSAVNCNMSPSTNAFRILNTLPCGRYVIWNQQTKVALDTVDLQPGQCADILVHRNERD